VASAREQYLQAMASLTEITRSNAERLASRLAKQGELQTGQVGRLAEDLVRRTQRNREILSRLVQREVKRQLSVLGIATRDEVSRLHQRVRALEQTVEKQAAATPRTAAAGRGTRRTASAASGRASGAATSRGSATSRQGTTGRATGSTGRQGTTGRSTGSSGRSRRAAGGQEPTKDE
jgi:polyhydroxyalkanoate synthesis regulator phasin